MSKLKFIALFFFFISAQIRAEQTDTLSIKYSADAVDSKNTIQYKETHEVLKKETGEVILIQTKYHSPAGQLIAELESDFKLDPFIPETVFFDHRFKEKQELHLNIESKTIQLKITDLDGKVKEKTFPRKDNMVSGQGFHNYILKNFESKTSEIVFIVLPKLDYFSFQVEATPPAKETEKRFSLKISNWLLRAIVSKLTVDYRIQDKHLVRFDGLTNIESDKRESQILTINYPQ